MDNRIPVYYNEGGMPFFIMHSTRYELPLQYEEKDDGSVFYTSGPENIVNNGTAPAFMMRRYHQGVY